jgi:hypothetical protein
MKTSEEKTSYSAYNNGAKEIASMKSSGIYTSNFAASNKKIMTNVNNKSS